MFTCFVARKVFTEEGDVKRVAVLWQAAPRMGKRGKREPPGSGGPRHTQVDRDQEKVRNSKMAETTHIPI